MEHTLSPQGLSASGRVLEGSRFTDKVSEGPGKGRVPPVVLVHGLGLSHRYMIPLAEHLAQRYQVWLPDLPGFGDSGKSLPALKVPLPANRLLVESFMAQRKFVWVHSAHI